MVTAALIKAVEETTHPDVDQFFDQWVYGAGAPKFDVSYTYDAEKKQVALTVKQTQPVEGHVGLFRVPVDVEITNATGPKLYPIVVSKAEETFPLPSGSAPQMVLFDKGNQVLKSTEFKKDKKELLYQLKNAGELADRADAALALGKLKGDDEAATALGEALRGDKARGVQEVAAESLGDVNSAVAAKQLLGALDDVKDAEVRASVVQALGSFKDSTEITAKLESVAKDDASYRARAAALGAIGQMKTPKAYETLSTAVNGESPDGFLRDAALRAFGPLGDDKAVPLLREWAAPGKATTSREAAINSLGRLQKSNKEITEQIAGYLNDPEFRVRVSSILALGARGDASAVPALEAMLKSNDLSIELAPMVKTQIQRLKNPGKAGAAGGHMGGESEPAAKSEEDQRLARLEQLVEEMNSRLKTIESRLPNATARP